MRSHWTKFDDFFLQATGIESPPFEYQRALADAEDWPQLVPVPTGTGKTEAAVLSWVWRRVTRPSNTPRRLVYCLPMRVLVSQTFERAVRWLANANLLAGHAEFDNGGRLLAHKTCWEKRDRISVVKLMGGEVDSDWREHPEVATILVGTQDMLLSRALNRGYAMGAQYWPIDFGLLNMDALWVMDEVQLMGPGRTTSVQLQLFFDAFRKGWGCRKTIWMSATLGSSTKPDDLLAWMATPEYPKCGAAIPTRIDFQEDVAKHREFGRRWQAPKQLESHLEGSQSPWTIESRDLSTRLVDEATKRRFVLVFVNQVPRARSLAERLRTPLRKAGLQPPLLVHARFRPRDRRKIEATLLTQPGQGRIVIATQALEAGIDLDADILVTEPCPWPSFVQRLGRVNRRGEKSTAEVVVLDLPEPSLERRSREKKADFEARVRLTRALPYEPDELDQTRGHLQWIQSHRGGSLSPESLSHVSFDLPLEGPVLRRFDALDLFDTDQDLSGGHTDVSPFVRALDRDDDVLVTWRRLEGGLPLEEQVPLHPDELCPVPVGEARTAFQNVELFVLTLATRKRERAWRRVHANELRPGDTVMVDVCAGCYSQEVGWLGKEDSKSRPTVVVDRWTDSRGHRRTWVRLGNAGHSISFDEDIDDRVKGQQGVCGDGRSFARTWMGLDEHLSNAERHARALTAILGLPEPLADAVETALRWHDVGKALERAGNGAPVLPFQDFLRRAGKPELGHPIRSELYAKSNGWKPGDTAGFRHELASTLAFLAAAEHSSNSDLTAFLIMSHHGKVRLMPTPWDDEDPVDLCGVRDGDRISAAARLGAGTTLALDLLQPSPNHGGWQGRVARLLREQGPFALAYLEALVRVSDWRAG
jgi:CRISPR-associated endonuclease/helicase Cas3